ncbi:MAG TPA: GNAT family N-acetyltransferase [Solirubrobacterales bacterium]|nr:GNAT family N-acetyltransferase [Solirubrobacterales bacterium]
MPSATEDPKGALGRVEKRFYRDLLATAVEFSRTPPRLEELGFAEGVTIRKYLRDAHPPRFPAPGGIEVIEVEGSDSPFGEIVALGSGRAGWTASVFAHLPGRQGWRCYLAIVDEKPMAAAAMLVDGKVAQFGLAATVETARKGAQLALMHRRIEDATALGVRQFAADVEVDDDAGSIAGRRDLRDAGFRPAYERDAWLD